VRNTLWIIGLALGVAAVASAQDVPRIEVFGGYSYGQIRGYAAPEGLLFPGSGIIPFPNFGSNGWTGSAAVNVTRWFGVVADASGLYAMPTRMIGSTPITLAMREHNYLFGPRISGRYKRLTLFGHALFGEAHDSVLIGAPEVLTPIAIVDTKFAFAVGGGVDITVYRRHRHPGGAGQELAIRVAQIDWLKTYFVGLHQDNIRLSAGLVFRF